MSDEPQIKIAWWVYPYIFACALFAKMMGMHPDIAKIRKTIRKGLSVKHKKDGKWAIFRRS